MFETFTLGNVERLEKMRLILRDTLQPDGTAAVADWLSSITGIGLEQRLGR
ncbi:MAG: hypothetical protein Kow00105_19790 [Phycisphaeraceae bacterium]